MTKSNRIFTFRSQRKAADGCSLFNGVKAVAILFVLLLLIFCESASCQWVPSQSVAKPVQVQEPLTPAELEQIIRKGDELETPKANKPTDWNEALNYWEKALKENPNETPLLMRYYRARIQYDITHRLADRLYVQLVNTASVSLGRLTLNDLLFKLELSYVDEINWKRVSYYGLAGVSQALYNPAFRYQYLVRVKNDVIVQMEQKWLQTARAIPINTMEDVFKQAVTIAAMAKRDCQINEAVIIMEYVCGVLNTLDQYTGLLTPTQLQDMSNQINGEFVGIGVELKTIKGELRVIRPLTNSPAQKAGLLPGDAIVAVNGIRAADTTVDKISNSLLGESGSTVQLEIARRNAPNQIFDIVRQPVKSPSIDNIKIIDPEDKVGYLKINHFQKTSLNELDAALLFLNSQGMKSLIIDLRGNPGGLLQAAVETSNRFLPAGVIVSTKGKNPQENQEFRASRPNTQSIPLVVLIDKNSASASEIFAGAMRDFKRAKIVGTRSYGKGSVQGIFRLQNSNLGLRMTTAKFYSPLGKPFVRVGVSPDVEVQTVALLNGEEDFFTVLTEQEDAVLQAGINAAKRQ